MSEVEQGLAAAVRRSLDDWDAWLVYADWLTVLMARLLRRLARPMARRPLPLS
jgi:hypothetical protein